jgi:hypothetical protein
MSFTAAQLKQDISILQAAAAAISAGLTNIPDDEAVVADGLSIAAPFVPGLAIVIDLLPVAEFVAAWVVANNTQGQPGSETPMHGSGGRGDLPGGEIA